MGQPPRISRRRQRRTRPSQYARRARHPRYLLMPPKSKGWAIRLEWATSHATLSPICGNGWKSCPPPVANKTRQGGATTLPLAKQNGWPAPEWASHFHYRGLRICTREVHGTIFAGGDIIRGEYIVHRFLGRTTKVAVARTVFPQRPLYPSITVLGGIDSIIELFF
jgi:hypothetical protein